MSLAIPVCASCATAAFPPRVLCPSCGSREWTTVDAVGGTVVGLTEHRGIVIASVRSDAGPVIIARAIRPLEPGEAVRFTGSMPPVVEADR
jgi:uncharacterized OB-fold protein